jgi:hypothetical protein
MGDVAGRLRHDEDPFEPDLWRDLVSMAIDAAQGYFRRGKPIGEPPSPLRANSSLTL